MKTVSVILPVFNGEKYIREAVESILSQSFEDFTLHVINDGSTDRTEEILNRFTDSRLQIITNETNLRLIETLNKGLAISIAGGYQYIARMDADDVSLPHRFEKQVRFMEANPDVGLCGSWVEEFDESGTIKISGTGTDHGTITADLFFQNTIWHPSVMMRTEVIAKHELRFESAFLHAEDYAMWCRIAEVSKLANIPEVLVKYRIHNHNVSVLHREQQRKTCDLISGINLDKLISAAGENNNSKSVRQKYQSLLRKIPGEAGNITADEIGVFKTIFVLNKKAGCYSEKKLKASAAAFLLQYWSLWCRKYSVKMLLTLFVQGGYLTQTWTIRKKIMVAGKCLMGWRARVLTPNSEI